MALLVEIKSKHSIEHITLGWCIKLHSVLFFILILLYLVMKCVHTVIIVCITQALVCSVKIVTWKSNSFCIQTLKQSYKCKQQLQNMTLEENAASGFVFLNVQLLQNLIPRMS